MAQDPNPSSNPQYDRLTGQLYHLPSIIGRLGLSIAEAQKELNLDYINSVARLMELIQKTFALKPDADAAAISAMQKMLEALAPSIYQFTETTIDFRADLSESVQKSTQVGASLGTGAVVVNAAMTLGYAHDYRASARITSVLHSRQVGGVDFAKLLLDRKKEIDTQALALPAATKVETDILDRTAKVLEGMGKKQES